MLESDEDSRSSNSSGSSSSSSESPIAETLNSTTEPQVEADTLKNEQEDEDIELSDIDENTSKNEYKPADISHEDLSDISDLESSNDVNSQDYSDLRHKLNKKRRQNGSESNAPSRKSDEEELDFEGDEEIQKKNPELISKNKSEKIESSNNESCGSFKEDGEQKSEKGEIESGEELEDGEVTDGDEKRPEESEPKAVCRFFTRGKIYIIFRSYENRFFFFKKAI